MHKNLVKVTNGNTEVPQLFFRKRYNTTQYPSEYTLIKTLKNHTPSLVAICNHKGLVLKLIRPRKYHEVVKLLWNHSRLSKETRGNRTLSKLGLNVPTIHEAGFGLIPAKKYEFIGYYLMDNLSEKGYDEVFNIFQEKISEELREKLFNEILNGLKLMQYNRIVFTDFTLGNVFGNTNGELIWIDTGVTHYNKISQSKFIKKNNNSMERLARIHKDLLTQQEKIKVRTLLM